eukprot:m.195619 g.195619  ORF g.195619 m.195619 type:complete len:219 (-) comp13669_c2_seq3:1811-2467(-)
MRGKSINNKKNKKKTMKRMSALYQSLIIQLHQNTTVRRHCSFHCRFCVKCVPLMLFVCFVATLSRLGSPLVSAMASSRLDTLAHNLSQRTPRSMCKKPSMASRLFNSSQTHHMHNMEEENDNGDERLKTTLFTTPPPSPCKSLLTVSNEIQQIPPTSSSSLVGLSTHQNAARTSTPRTKLSNRASLRRKVCAVSLPSINESWEEERDDAMNTSMYLNE